MAMFGLGNGARLRIIPASSLLAAAVVGARGITPVPIDMQAVQVSSRANAVDHDSGRANFSASVVEKAARLRGWVEGTGNTCPAGATQITQDECEAFAMMDSSPHTFSLLSDNNVAKFYLGNTVAYPTSDATRPKGCSMEAMGSFRFFFFNTHPVGAAKAKARPACKSDTWSMYKSKCPTGTVSVDESACIDFTNDKHHYRWGGQVASAADPPGCFGRAGAGMPTYGVDTFAIGKVFFNTVTDGSLTNKYAFPVCKLAATTPAPPAVAGASGGSQAQATGDPHMTTIGGVKFDIMRAGTHTLVHIPQAALKADTLLRAQARVFREGDKCEDMYIKVLNVTGRWAEEKRVGGFSFVTASPGPGQQVASQAGAAEWARLGKVDLKVVRGRTASGVLYLNMYFRHLISTSKTYPIGGILGLDDHAEAATPPADCDRKVLSLLGHQ